MSDQESDDVPRRRVRRTSRIEPSDNEEDETLPTRTSKPPSNTTLFYVAITVMTIACGVFIGALFFWRPSTEVFTPNSIVADMPSRSCLRVDDATILRNQHDKRWQKVVRSMHYYMNTRQLEGISAFHLGEADCFVMTRMPDNSTLAMYNPQFMGYASRAISVIPERSLACPSIQRMMKRSDVVLARYVDDRMARTMVISLEEEQAWSFQHVNSYSLGKTICDLHAENTDLGVEGLQTLIVE